MKKFLFIAAMASVALVSCVKNEVIPVNEEGQEISFMTAPVTKADPSFSTSNKFISYAYLVTGTDALKPWASNSNSSTPYIENKLIQYHAASGTSSAKWAHATDVYYWPKDQYSQLTFFAWADGTADPAGTGKPAATCSNTTGVKFENYDITETANKNRDIMVAKIAADKRANETATGGTWADGVPTVFQHILSSFDTKIKLNDTYTGVTFNLKSIDLLNVDTKNTYTQGVDATKEPKSYGWGTPSEPETLSIYSGPMEVNSTSEQNIVETGYTILMPQTFAASTEQIKIVYDVVTHYAGTEVTETVTVVKDLVDMYTSGWAAGSAYTLTITLGLNEILWDPAVENWATGTAGTWDIN